MLLSSAPLLSPRHKWPEVTDDSFLGTYKYLDAHHERYLFNKLYHGYHAPVPEHDSELLKELRKPRVRFMEHHPGLRSDQTAAALTMK